MRKKGSALLSVLFAAALLFAALPLRVSAAGSSAPHLHTDAEGNVIEFAAWDDPTALPSDGGAWYLTEDVTLKRDWMPAADTALCLNGHVITTEDECCLWLEEVSLDLYDEEDSAVHCFAYHKGGAWTYAGESAGEDAVELGEFSLDSVSDGTLIAVHGGAITGSGMFLNLLSDDRTEPQVKVDMFGGNIVGIRSEYAEPVGIVGDAAFTMYGGSIAGCFFPYGDILRNRSGSAALLGGTITGNIASGAIVSSGAYTDIVIGGSASVHDNVAEKGAVYAGETEVTLGGSARIENNVTAGGEDRNVYLSGDHRIVLRSPGEGMRVGITVKETPAADNPVMFTEAASEADAGRFFSDSGYTVKFCPDESSADALYLTAGSGVASVFGSSDAGLMTMLTGVLAAGMAAAVIAARKKNAAGTE